MTSLRSELDRLEHQIARSSLASRHQYQPQLRKLIQRMEENGAQVPPSARRLHAELVCEAIEAQFDNMPV